MILPNGDTIFETEYNCKCEKCGTTFELGYFGNKLLCTECAKYFREKEQEKD